MIENIKVFVADIDMTLAGKGEGLPQVTKDAFKVLRNNGVLLGLATGRELDDRLKKQAENWGLDYNFDFFIAMNGGQVYNTHNDSYWAIDLMSTSEMRRIMNHMMPLIDKYKIMVNTEGAGNHSIMNGGDEIVQMMKRHGFEFDDTTGDLDKFCSKQCFKILFRTLPEYADEVRKTFLDEFGDKYQMVSTFPGTLEALEKGVNKGLGLKRYCEDNGIALENVISFGDNENDNDMLKVSGWGVALKDGNPKTQEIANDVTDYDCLDGGVGHYLFDKYITPKGLK